MSQWKQVLCAHKANIIRSGVYSLQYDLSPVWPPNSSIKLKKAIKFLCVKTTNDLLPQYQSQLMFWVCEWYMGTTLHRYILWYNKCFIYFSIHYIKSLQSWGRHQVHSYVERQNLVEQGFQYFWKSQLLQANKITEAVPLLLQERLQLWTPSNPT